jgi:hypothetical protein
MSSTILPQVRSASKSSRVPFYQPPGHPIAYFPSLAPYVGGSNAAILCCQLVYWTPRAKDPDGWIYKEQLDIMAETGLSRDEQRTARRALKTRKLLLERYDRLNHRLYLKIDVEAYNALIQRMYDEGVDPEGLPKPLKINQIRKPYLAKLAFRIWRKTETVSGEMGNSYIAKDPETTAEITLPEISSEREKNVNPNVGSDRDKTPRKFHLTARQQDIVEVLEEQFNDTHSRPTFCIIVKRLPEELVLGCMHAAFDAERAGKIKTSLSAYFIDLVKREARRQGIDLGFTQKGGSHAEAP